MTFSSVRYAAIPGLRGFKKDVRQASRSVSNLFNPFAGDGRSSAGAEGAECDMNGEHPGEDQQRPDQNAVHPVLHASNCQFSVRRRYSMFTAFRHLLLAATQSNEDAKREHLKKQGLRTIVGEKSAASGWGMKWIWGQLRQWQRHEPCPRKRVPERVTY